MNITTRQKWDYINQLDEELLQGGIALSEWTTFLAKDAEIAFCSGAYIASILACQAAIESHLKYDYFNSEQTCGWSFYNLIEKSDLEDELKNNLHSLRKYRNKWIHVNDPACDEDLLEKPDYYEEELLEFAKKSIKTMLEVLYSNPFI
ncbi:MAG: hypothetical protein FWH27_13805 [Planctomycetaceae bacterium]|nr:hypothetical protein [Planctomycetaceae bacterium]